ncbi:hypothetical protein HNQ91_000263 [Filimonas zeae]|uniref:hypothetical protein n=1 Tax=Filimonas zeae TaxID=1737353 RepID=UPI00166330C0|nr:hypothetical protein [Filimonas zeae]MDR6337241.1 hypothetical protein [Filimonas zeae]
MEIRAERNAPGYNSLYSFHIALQLACRYKMAIVYGSGSDIGGQNLILPKIS